MTVDHFHPQRWRPELKRAWSNLYYACVVCNSHHKKDHPDPDEVAEGKRFVDPCAEDPDDHFRMTRDLRSGDYCKVKPLSDAAEYTGSRLKLNHRKFLRDYWRSLDHEVRRLEKRRGEVDRLLSECQRWTAHSNVGQSAAEIHRDYAAELDRIRARLADVAAERPFPIGTEAE